MVKSEFRFFNFLSELGMNHAVLHCEFTIESINQNLFFKPARHTKNMEITKGLLKEKFDQFAIVCGAAKLPNPNYLNQHSANNIAMCRDPKLRFVQ